MEKVEITIGAQVIECDDNGAWLQLYLYNEAENNIEPFGDPTNFRGQEVERGGAIEATLTINAQKDTNEPRILTKDQIW